MSCPSQSTQLAEFHYVVHNDTSETDNSQTFSVGKGWAE
jgi:hypothetical protein